jgi:hypothetical protein
MAAIGDGVMYHGSKPEYHGLYVVVGEDNKVPGRWVLASPDDPENVLFHVRPSSFEVLLSAELINGE